MLRVVALFRRKAGLSLAGQSRSLNKAIPQRQKNGRKPEGFRPSSTEGLHVWETSGQKPIPEPGKVREERMLQRNITPAK
jgi:hypothetical protein